MRLFFVSIGSILALAALACSSGPNDTDQRNAATICKEQIGCGYQRSDQASCETLFLQLVDSAKLQQCNDCVVKEGCATEQKACESFCRAN